MLKALLQGSWLECALCSLLGHGWIQIAELCTGGGASAQEFGGGTEGPCGWAGREDFTKVMASGTLKDGGN